LIPHPCRNFPCWKFFLYPLFISCRFYLRSAGVTIAR
jgi:hypothetical protein